MFGKEALMPATNKHTDHLETFLNALLSGDRAVGANVVHELMQQGVSIYDIYENYIKSALYRVGELWEYNKITVAQEHLATSVSEAIMNELFSDIISHKRVKKKAMVASVEGEQHQVGAKMVADIFEMNGWDSYFLGANILEELRQANEQLTILNSEKNQYIGMAAHDLRSPISTAISYVDILRNDDGTFDSSKKQRFLEIIGERLSFSLKLMSQLLDVSKIESGIIQLNVQRNDYVKLLKQTIEFNRLVARYKNISIDFEARNQYLPFMFDKAKMEQVLNNLISNAIKYSPANSHVLIKLDEGNGKIRTSIIDQGVGIKSSELSEIFQPFYKASGRPTAGENSTGLGLAIAKKIIEEHGGDIEVSSEVNKGSCFSFTLPARLTD